MRVIAGEFRGRRLVAPAGLETRPSASRLREALFSALGRVVVGVRVVDLFAGSGALGIESLSRGAAHATFVDSDTRALAAVRRNLDALGLGPDRATVVRLDAWRWIERFDPATPGPRVVLADPPYAEDAAGRLLPRAARWVQSGALDAFVLEHPARTEVGLEDPAIRVRTRVHGRGAFTIVEAAPSSAGGRS